MGKISKLIQSNIRKDAKQTVSFFLIIVLATVLLYTGLMTFFGYQSLFESKVKELNTPNILAVIESQETEKINQCLEKVQGIQEYEYTDMIHAVIINEVDGEDNVGDILFQRYSDFGVSDKPNMVEVSEKEYDNAIYLPLVCKYYWDSELDQEFSCQIGDEEYTFMIAGFYERMLTGGNGVYRYSMFVNDKDFERISQNPEAHNNTAYFTMIDETEDDEVVSVRIAKELGKENISTFNITRTDGEFARTYLSDIISSVFIIFSLIVAAITLMVINFRISNSIEQDIRNIGVQKAIGYTSKQIRGAIVLQFAMVTTVAVALGIGFSYIVLPLVEGMIRTEAIVVWNYGIDFRCVGMTCGILIVSAIVVSLLSTKKIQVLQPVIALRQGLSNHNFKKNHFPLENSKGPIGCLLAWKSVFQSARQNILLVITMIVIGFAMEFILMFGYNVIFDDTRLMRLLSSNHENALVYLSDETIMEEISEMEGVEKVYKYNSEMYAMAGDYQIYIESTEDFDDFRYTSIYEGRAPKHDNEIAIAGNVAKRLNVNVGDEIEITSGAYTEKFIIVGLTQTTSGAGWACYITEEARINRLHIPMNYTITCVSLTGGPGEAQIDKTDDFIEELKDTYGEQIIGAYNTDFSLYSRDNSLLQLMKILIVVICALILLLIVLVIHLVMRTVVIRRQQEFGIEKAIGFTSGQIRRQLALETMSVSMVGNIVGVIVGSLFSNKLVTLLFQGFGVMQADFLVPETVGIVAVVGLAVFVYGITYFVSKSVKKISAYRLISE